LLEPPVQLLPAHHFLVPVLTIFFFQSPAFYQFSVPTIFFFQAGDLRTIFFFVQSVAFYQFIGVPTTFFQAGALFQFFASFFTCSRSSSRGTFSSLASI
jgi:hypothetical protein